MVKLLEEINADTRKRGIFLNISGPLSQDMMVEMGEILKRKLQADGTGKTVIHQVFSILVELNQNIIHYSAEKIWREDKANGEKNAGCGIMSVGYQAGHYFLMAGNMIENQKVDSMKLRLDHLNSMDKEELNQMYRQQRKGFPDEDSKGAGLGLIEVARKVSRPLQYHFEEIGEGMTFFTLKTVV